MYILGHQYCMRGWRQLKGKCLQSLTVLSAFIQQQLGGGGGHHVLGKVPCSTDTNDQERASPLPSWNLVSSRGDGQKIKLPHQYTKN